MERHKAIAAARDKIEQTWENALQQVESLYREILSKTEGSYDGAFECVRWYRRGNIMNLDLERLQDAFEDHPIQDPVDFAAYILERVTIAIQQRREEPCWLGVLAFQIGCLCNALIDSPNPRARASELHFNAQMLASVLHLNTGALSSPYRVAIEETCRDRMRHTLTNTTSDCYVGAAAARRVIWSRYGGHLDDAGKRTGREAEGFGKKCDLKIFPGRRCFHQNSANLLQELTERARLEIRSNAFLAAQSRLPVELVDDIFEFALSSEEIPLENVCLSELDQTEVTSAMLEAYDCGHVKYFRHHVPILAARHAEDEDELDWHEDRAEAELQEELHEKMMAGI